MLKRTMTMIAAALVGGCSEQAAEAPAANEAAAVPEKPPHCFFKDNETKEWAATPKGDQIVVSGRAFRSDSRYKAVLLEPKIDGGIAVVRPTISTNDTGFAAVDNWWNVETLVPAAGVTKVEVRCGKNVVASFDLASKTG